MATRFLTMKKFYQEYEDCESYNSYVLSCIRECKESVPFEIYNKNNAS